MVPAIAWVKTKDLDLSKLFLGLKNTQFILFLGKFLISSLKIQIKVMAAR